MLNTRFFLAARVDPRRATLKHERLVVLHGGEGNGVGELLFQLIIEFKSAVRSLNF